MFEIPYYNKDDIELYTSYREKLNFILNSYKIKFSEEFNGYFRVIERGFYYSLCSNISFFIFDTGTSLFRICIPNEYVDNCKNIKTEQDIINTGSTLDEYNMWHNLNFNDSKENKEKIGIIEMEVNRNYLPFEYLISEHDNIHVLRRLFYIENGYDLSNIIEKRKNVPKIKISSYNSLNVEKMIEEGILNKIKIYKEDALDDNAIYGESMLHHAIPILRKKQELDRAYERRLTF